MEPRGGTADYLNPSDQDLGDPNLGSLHWTLRGAVDLQQCHGRDLGGDGENHETLIHIIFTKKLFSEEIGLMEVII